MNHLHKLKFIFVALLISSPTYAWLHFEPLIGYNKGQEQGSALQGIGLGARVGVDFKDIFIAADYDYSDLQMGSTSSAKYTNTGITLGGGSSSFRLWYGVITAAQFTYPSSNLTVTTKGSGNKFGMGAKLGSGSMFINLEVKSLNYTTNDPGNGVSAAINEIATIGFLSLSWVL